MALAASLLMLGLFYLYFENSLQARNNPNQQLQIAPGSELVLKRSGDGHYVFPGTINGQPVTFLLDTGATLVSVPAHLADKLGLEAGAHQQSITANGTVATRATRVDALAFGPFDLRGVSASLFLKAFNIEHLHLDDDSGAIGQNSLHINIAVLHALQRRHLIGINDGQIGDSLVAKVNNGV